MVTVHHLENSRSQRILWMLEELGIDYDIKHYKRDAKTSLAPKELKQVHPLGKSPVITDGDLVIAETGAIIEYLLENYADGRFVPKPGTPEKLRYTYWLHTGEGSIMPLFVMKLVFTKITQPPVPFFIRPVSKAIAGKVGKSFIDPGIQAHLQQMEAELGKSEWFAGDELTGADFLMIFPAEAAAVRSDLSSLPNLKAYIERVHSRPAYQTALDKGGPYDLMG